MLFVLFNHKIKRRAYAAKKMQCLLTKEEAVLTQERS